MNISHVGIGTGEGLTFALASGLKIAPGTQADFTHYNKLATRTTTQGECELASAGDVVVGVIVDVSPKGDSCTVETCGFEWVKYAGTAPAVGDLVCVKTTDGVVEGVAIVAFVDDSAAASPTAAQLRSGVWQVDQVDTVNSRVLIDLEARL